MQAYAHILWAVFYHILIYTLAKRSVCHGIWTRQHLYDYDDYWRRIRKFMKTFFYQFTSLLISVVALLVRLSLVRTSLVRNIMRRVFVLGVRNCLATTVFNRRNVQLMNKMLIHEFSISWTSVWILDRYSNE